jgi:anti-sigma regulatory factor (Ser/Thr protein kinase)
MKANHANLFREFGSRQIVYFESGHFYRLNGELSSVPNEEKIQTLIYESDHMYDWIEDNATGKMYHLHWMKINEKVFVLLNEASVANEKAQEGTIRKFYRDVIYSVTMGKLLFLEEDELHDFYQKEKLAEVPIKKKTDVSICRKIVKQLLDDMGIENTKKLQLLLATSEATTNALKHAVDGTMKIYKDGDLFRIIVEDSGDGIPLSELPKATLIMGYSSKLSLGQGFGLLMKASDQVALHTSSYGTTVIIEAKLNYDKQLDRLNNHVSLLF